jgi:hypothetical protein
VPKFERGAKKLPNSGRRPGSPNKVPKAVREAIIEALNAGAGATEFFLKLKGGSAEDRRCFAHLCGRLLPLEVSAVVTPIAFDPNNMIEIGRRAAFILQSAAIAREREVVQIEDKAA